MNPKFAIVLALLILGSALLAAYLGQRGEQYFPAVYESTKQDCAVDPGWSFEITPSSEPILHPGEADDFGNVLGGLDERSLYLRTRDEQMADLFAIRFTWIGSFDPSFVIRVEREPSGGMRLIAKQDAKLIDSRTYRPVRRVDRRLTDEEIRSLLSLIAETRVFEAPLTGCVYGADGAVWLLERADGRSYRLTKRWSPQGGPVRELGLAMLSLTGWYPTAAY